MVTPPQDTALPVTAAGMPLISTVAEPAATARGWFECLGLECSARGSPTRATGLPSTRTSGEPAMTGVGGNPSWSVPRSPNKTTFLLIPLLLQSVTESVLNFLTSRVPLQYP